VRNGAVIWITGLSGAGKTTLARAVAAYLREQSVPVVLLDGDDLREVFGVATDTVAYEGAARLALAWQYARLCRVLATQGVTVVIGTISLFHEIHAWNRAHLPGYFEVFLDVPLAELRRRDSNGIYSRFDAGELSNVIGLDLPVQFPQAPHWVVRYDSRDTVDTLAAQLVTRAAARTLLSS